MTTAEQSLGFGLDFVEDGMNYYAWLARAVHSHLRGRVLEHGAGTGALALSYLDLGVESAVLSEPTPHLASMLRRKFEKRANVSVFEGTIEDYFAQEGPATVESIVSSNVLEHIEDDVQTLRTMLKLLAPGGTLALYVPARPELFGAIDKAVGHCRRYRKNELVNKVELAGFEVESATYRNIVSGVAWFVTGRLLKRGDVGGGNIRLYDKVIFPVSQFIEDRFSPPWGQNLLLLARKPIGC